ncbi:MAG: hypothetical protein JO110_12425 [Acetobacteraceae bacterium]|nr:hypothetical protein [Acetobacteraceae bacterium]
MPGNPRDMVTSAERRFPLRIRIGVPPSGLGQRHTQITAWLDENCGADGWAMTPSGTRGVLNDALSIYFADAALANAFVARWCIGARMEASGGGFQVREDEPVPRLGAGGSPHPEGMGSTGGARVPGTDKPLISRPRSGA